MATEGHLRNPPIREAIVEVRILPVSIDGWAQRIRSALGNEFPTINEQRQLRVSATFAMGSEPPTAKQSDLGVQSYILQDTSKLIAAQFRNDGFALSVLPPYPGWNKIAPIATHIWSEYLKLAGVVSVKRVGLRFINRVSIPLTPDYDLDQFLRGAPRIPEKLPQVFQDFIVRVVAVADSEGRLVSIAQSLTPPSSPTSAVDVVIDIDAFSTPEVPSFRIENIAGEFESLRAIKNAAFFGSVTDRALEAYR
jgi:uncharacterized protein (TIGR04255 family)